ncbi:hypothetical protein ACIO8F_30435 [Streptomyces sp. NPDC087228]
MQLPRELHRTAAVGTVRHAAIRSAHTGIDDERLRAVMPTARDEEQEVGP